MLHLAILFCVVFNVVAAEVRLEETAPLRIVDITEYVEAPSCCGRAAVSLEFD